jgi:hypothetical protein
MTQLNLAEEVAIEQHRVVLEQQQGRQVSLDESRADWEATRAVKWREERQAEMLAHEREEILRHKWIESEKAQRDLGAEAVLDWIHRYAAQWREWYQEKYEESRA